MDDAGPTLAGVIAAVAPGPAAIGVAVDLAQGTEPGRVVLLVPSETEIEVRRADRPRAECADKASRKEAGRRIERRPAFV